jgi:hypothetical protein
LALIVVVLSACSRAPSPGSSMTGGATARDAATQFMNAVKAQDLMAMGSVWGNSRGPARETLERSDLDARLVLLQQCYNHDRFQILDDSSAPSGGRIVRVQITRGNVTRTPSFRIVTGPSNRWYVEDTDFATVQGQFCSPP